MKIGRRALMMLSGAALSCGLLCTPALAQETLTGVTYLPQSYEALSYGSNGFVEHLKKNASKAVEVDFYDSGKLLGADEQLPALRAGNIDFMFHTTSYITRSLPILGITGLPEVVEDLYENPDRLKIGSPLFNLINEVLAKDGLYMLAIGGLLEPEYIWSTKGAPVRSLEDLKGKRVRVVGFEATEALKEYGAAPVRVPSSEIYLAMQRGTVDAAVANISTIIGRSVQEQTGTVYKLPVTGYGIGVFMLRKRWDALDPEVKKALQEAAQWFDNNAAEVANNDIYKNKFWPRIQEAGVDIIEVSPQQIQQFQENSSEVTRAWAKEVGEDIAQKAIALALGKS